MPTIQFRTDEATKTQSSEIFGTLGITMSDAININSCLDGSDAIKLQETLDFLANYTVRHFHFEEALQIQYGYPDYDRHKKLHEDFSDGR